MSHDTDRFFIVTGGPGAGKTTLLDALEKAGFARTVEAGRAVIQDQVAISGPALPWRDPGLFAEAMFAWEMRSYRQALAEPGPVFFDRGIPDTIAYLRLMERPVPAHMMEAAAVFRYNPLVFVAPFWPEIFANDAERKQTPEEAERTCAKLIETYRELGFDLAMLPLASVAERVRFVLERTGPATSPRPPSGP
ncbi:MAG: AAA family ATPase [Parvibaculaceae bacterium]